MTETNDTHRKSLGYILWIFGFTGAHRFYYGKPVTGTIYFFTLGLLFIGWFIDLFLIPSMDSKADLRFRAGRVDYSLAWILLTFLGLFGVHRMYMGKWLTGILWLITGGLLAGVDGPNPDSHQAGAVDVTIVSGKSQVIGAANHNVDFIFNLIIIHAPHP